MRYQSIKQIVVLGLAMGGLACPTRTRADLTVHSGWDLFVTIPEGTTFDGVNWQGVPLGVYNFGAGNVPLGQIDTLVHRLADAHAASEVIPITMDALQLRSVNPIDLGAGLGYYYVTLQSLRGGPASLGTMNIVFGPEGNPHGTFSSSLDVFFDIRLGSLAGPIVASGDEILTSSGVPWRHEPPPGSPPLIPGVNYQLNGVDISQDFWPGFPAWTTNCGNTYTFVENGVLVVHQVADCPEPSSVLLVLVGLGLSGFTFFRRKGAR